MAFEYPDDLRYLDSHEYVRADDDTATVGISAFAVDQLGDIVFVELPEIGDEVSKGETFGSIESVKAVEDLNSPVTGKVIEVNQVMIDSPENIGDDPYGDGWLVKVSMENSDDINDAMEAKEYKGLVEGD